MSLKCPALQRYHNPKTVRKQLEHHTCISMQASSTDEHGSIVSINKLATSNSTCNQMASKIVVLTSRRRIQHIINTHSSWKEMYQNIINKINFETNVLINILFRFTALSFNNYSTLTQTAITHKRAQYLHRSQHRPGWWENCCHCQHLQNQSQVSQIRPPV